MMRSDHRPSLVLVAGCLTALLSVNPATAEKQAPTFEHALALFEAGKYDPAADALREILKSSPDWGDGYYLVGWCRLRTGRAYEAAGYFRLAMERGEERYQYPYGLARAYIELGRYDDARAALDEVERLAPAERLRSLDKLREWLDRAPVRRPFEANLGLYDLPPRYWRHRPVEQPE